jgi:hypothetical protein
MLNPRDNVLFTYKEILAKIPQECIMEFYLETQITGELIRSPFRVDERPGCSFWKSPSNILYFKD